MAKVLDQPPQRREFTPERVANLLQEARQRITPEIEENMGAVGRFVASVYGEVTDDRTQRTCMDEYMRVVKGEIGSKTCIRNMKRIIQKSHADPLLG